MLARELIELLQKKIKDHDPAEEMFGELQIHVDVFKSVTGEWLRYAGLSPEISLEFTPDGYFLVIGQKEPWGDNEGQITY